MNLKSIAQKTGFSESTVSRALNNDPRISQKTTRVIQEMAEKMNYQKDFAAMNLNNQESNILGIVFPPDNFTNSNNPFYIEIIKQAAYVAAKHNYMISVILAANADDLAEKIDMMISQGKVRKYIMLYNLQNDPIINKLKQSKVNFVVVGDPKDVDVVFVDNDNVEVGKAVANKIMDQDRNARPLYIKSVQNWQFEIDRQAGLLDVFESYGTALSTTEFDDQSRSTKDLINQYDTIIVSSDDLLIKLYGLLDIKMKTRLISFNNSVYIKPISDKIISVDLHPHEMGSKAAELLFEPDFSDVKKANYVGYTI